MGMSCLCHIYLSQLRDSPNNQLAQLCIKGSKEIGQGKRHVSTFEALQIQLRRKINTCVPTINPTRQLLTLCVCGACTHASMGWGLEEPVLNSSYPPFGALNSKSPAETFVEDFLWVLPTCKRGGIAGERQGAMQSQQRQ